MIAHVVARLRCNALLGNLSWMMVAEILSRASRFLTLFVLAASFSSAQYGSIMLALMCHEILRVFTQLGAGAMVIQCRDDDLERISGNALTLQWSIALSVAALQIAIAPFLAAFYSNPDIESLLVTMALAHVIYPLVSIKVFRLQRANRMRYFGIASGSCIAFENILVAALVLLDASLAMIAYSKVAAAVFWVMLFLRSMPIRVRPVLDVLTLRQLLGFSSKVFGSELVRALRWQADSLFAARLLSPELFGLYSFAKSASIGISQSFSAAYLAGSYPYLSQQHRAGQWPRALRLCVMVTTAILVLYLLQALLAPWYITLLFGDRWQAAIDVAQLMCLVAIPVLIADLLALTWRVQHRVGRELGYITLCSTVLLATLVLFTPDSPLAMACLVLSVSGGWVVMGLLCLIPAWWSRWGKQLNAITATSVANH
ncbi:MAG: oligosaccharide flippase family protein [Pseudomonadota bacterium]|nr:oligosaccharide flippase family protein [Pseudomonadota bacterium]